MNQILMAWVLVIVLFIGCYTMQSWKWRFALIGSSVLCGILATHYTSPVLTGEVVVIGQLAKALDAKNRHHSEGTKIQKETLEIIEIYLEAFLMQEAGRAESFSEVVFPESVVNYNPAFFASLDEVKVTNYLEQLRIWDEQQYVELVENIQHHTKTIRYISGQVVTLEVIHEPNIGSPITILHIQDAAINANYQLIYIGEVTFFEGQLVQVTGLPLMRTELNQQKAVMMLASDVSAF